MAPNTALGFVLAGTAVLLLTERARVTASTIGSVRLKPSPCNRCLTGRSQSLQWDACGAGELSP